MENEVPTPGPAVKPGRPVIQTAIVILVTVLVMLLLLPTIDRLQNMQHETASTNKLKQMGLGIQGFDAAQGALPARAFPDQKDGTPRSWRWSIWPNMEQDAYFNSRNVPVIPEYFAPPGGDPTSPLTPYKAFAFENSPFAVSKNPKLYNRSEWSVQTVSATPRGSSNLIFCIEANDPVEWSKPGDIDYDPAGQLPEMKPLFRRNGWLVLMADGSTKFVRTSVRESAFRAAIDPCGDSKEPNP